MKSRVYQDLITGPRSNVVMLLKTCSPQHMCIYLRNTGSYCGFTLLWDWGGASDFEVDTGSTRNMGSQYANGENTT